MLQKVWIKQFRNLEEILLSLTKKENIFIYGENNQGKTNFLEALYCAGNITSPNEGNIKNLIKLGFGETYLGVDFLSHGDTQNRIYIKLLDNGKKHVIFNGKEIKTVNKLQSVLPIDYISADEIRIFQVYPEARRKSLDRFLGVRYPEYSNLIRDYNRIVKQKLLVLKENGKREDIGLWNIKILEYGEQIFCYRVKGLEELRVVLYDLGKKLRGVKIDSLELRNLVKGNDGQSIDKFNYRDFIENKLAENVEKEVQAGMVLYGPHRDDYEVNINGKDLRTFFSRGINRTLSILLRLAKLIILKDKTGYFPILLIDEALAELDRGMKEDLVKIIEKYTQIFYATTQREDSDLFSGLSIYNMKLGKISYEGCI